MGKTKSGESRTERVGQVRCHNCLSRFRPPLGAAKASCPECNWEWYISWKGRLAKIRKPVWDNWERQITKSQQSEG